MATSAKEINDGPVIVALLKVSACPQVSSLRLQAFFFGARSSIRTLLCCQSAVEE
jgi:hypothetical protein